MLIALRVDLVHHLDLCSIQVVVRLHVGVEQGLQVRLVVKIHVGLVMGYYIMNEIYVKIQ